MGDVKPLLPPFDEAGSMQRRFASINDLAIAPAEHPGLRELGL